MTNDEIEAFANRAIELLGPDDAVEFGMLATRSPDAFVTALNTHVGEELTREMLLEAMHHSRCGTAGNA